MIFFLFSLVTYVACSTSWFLDIGTSHYLTNNEVIMLNFVAYNGQESVLLKNGSIDPTLKSGVNTLHTCSSCLKLNHLISIK